MTIALGSLGDDSRPDPADLDPGHVRGDERPVDRPLDRARLGARRDRRRPAASRGRPVVLPAAGSYRSPSPAPAAAGAASACGRASASRRRTGCRAAPRRARARAANTADEHDQPDEEAQHRPPLPRRRVRPRTSAACSCRRPWSRRVVLRPARVEVEGCVRGDRQAGRPPVVVRQLEQKRSPTRRSAGTRRRALEQEAGTDAPAELLRDRVELRVERVVARRLSRCGLEPPVALGPLLANRARRPSTSARCYVTPPACTTVGLSRCAAAIRRPERARAPPGSARRARSRAGRARRRRGRAGT